MIRPLLVIIIFSVIQLNVTCQDTQISIKNPGPENSVFSIYTLDYPFFDLKTMQGEINGNASILILPVKKTIALYLDFGPYQCYFFAEPGKKYSLELPDISSISDDWKDNPFFIKELYHLKLFTDENSEGEIELNNAIWSFNKEYEPFLDKQLIRFYDPALASEKRDSFMRATMSTKQVSDQKYYDNYILSKKAILEFSNSRHDLEKLINLYILKSESNFNNPAYRELYGLLLQKYFDFLGEKPGFQNLGKIFHDLSLGRISGLLKEDPLLQSESDFYNILLHEAFEAYFTGFYDKEKLRILCDSIAIVSDKSYVKTLVQYISNKFIRFETGFAPPPFEKLNLKGDSINLDFFKGKYTLICFLDNKSLSSLKEIEYLKLLYARHQKYINILSFIITEDSSGLIDFADFHSIKWTVIPIPQNDEILSDYMIRGIPVFFLIDKKGLLLLNPASLPSENFEQRLYEILKSRGEI